MKVLLIGATGQLGADLVRNNAGHEIHAPLHGELDLADAGDAIRRLRPDAVINCAAFHNVPLCEEKPEEAFRINAIAVRDVAAACEAAGAWLVTFSSDYVFGGEKREPYLETDRPQPLQVYGATRLAGENLALAAAPARAVVIRTCGLYGTAGSRSKGGNFVDGRVADGRAGKRIEMASEQTVAPTSTHDLSQAVHALLAHPQLAPGLYHLVNEGSCTWYELTRAIVETLRLPAEVVPVDRGGRSGAMRRPLYSVLANTRARALGIRLRPWREALVEYLRTKYS
jgi:dTDP-4-dehydrorhamnose reductase